MGDLIFEAAVEGVVANAPLQHGRQIVEISGVPGQDILDFG